MTLGKLYSSWRRVQRADDPGAYARTVLKRTYLQREHEDGDAVGRAATAAACAGDT